MRIDDLAEGFVERYKPNYSFHLEINEVAQDYPDVADRLPTLGILNERLSSAIKVGSTLGIAFVVVTMSFTAFFLTKIMDHGERLAQIQGALRLISEEQEKAVSGSSTSGSRIGTILSSTSSNDMNGLSASTPKYFSSAPPPLIPVSSSVNEAE